MEVKHSYEVYHNLKLRNELIEELKQAAEEELKIIVEQEAN